MVARRQSDGVDDDADYRGASLPVTEETRDANEKRNGNERRTFRSRVEIRRSSITRPGRR